MKLLDVIPSPYRIAAELAVAAAALIVAFAAGHRGGYQVGHAEAVAVQARWDRANAISAATAASASESNRTEEHRRTSAQQEVIHATQPNVDAFRAAAARVPDLDRRVRDATAALTACRRAAASDPPAAAGSAPADETAGVLAELQRSAQAAEAARTRYADEAAAAGQRCERSYDSLSPP